MCSPDLISSLTWLNRVEMVQLLVFSLNMRTIEVAELRLHGSDISWRKLILVPGLE